MKARRELLGISQGVLAVKANLHRTYITDIERGARNLTLENIWKIANGFGLPVSELFPSPPPSAVPLEPLPAFPVDILIAEQDQHDIALVISAFREANVTNRIHVVRDGASALDFIFTHTIFNPHGVPWTILLDLDLPGVGGLEVLRRISTEPSTRNLKVVVLSGKTTDNRLNEAIRLGALGSLIKPVSFHDFSQITPRLDLGWVLLNKNQAVGMVHSTERERAQVGNR